MRFSAQADAFVKFARSARERNFPPCRPDARPTAFLILPCCCMTAVPWYLAGSGACFIGRAVCRSKLSSLTWPARSNPAESAGQVPIIERVLLALDDRLPFTRLSAQSPVELSASDRAEIERLTDLNTISYLRRTGQTSTEAIESFRATLGEGPWPDSTRSSPPSG